MTSPPSLLPTTILSGSGSYCMLSITDWSIGPSLSSLSRFIWLYMTLSASPALSFSWPVSYLNYDQILTVPYTPPAILGFCVSSLAFLLIWNSLISNTVDPGALLDYRIGHLHWLPHLSEPSLQWNCMFTSLPITVRLLRPGVFHLSLCLGS